MGKHVIERFEDLVTRILSKSEFPVIKWADKMGLAERSSSNPELTEKSAKDIIAYVNKHLFDAGLTAPFPFTLRTSKTVKNTIRIEYNKKAVEPALTSFFEKYDDHGKKKLKVQVYQDPCATAKAVIHTQYAVEKKIPQVDMRKHIIFVLDHSSSMEAHSKLEHLKKLVAHAITQLGDEDVFSIVCFNENANILYRSQHKSKFDESKLKAIKAKGSTNLLLPFQLIKSEKLGEDECRKVVYFVTDGQHTDDTDIRSDRIPEAIHETLSDNMSLITIGIGSDYDARMIQKLSSMVGNPVPVHVQDESGFEAAFRTMQVLSLPLTEQVKLQLMTDAKKVNLHKTLNFPFNVEQEGFFTIEKSELKQKADLILIDKHKTLVRQTISSNAAPEIMPPKVMMAWIRNRIHEILTDEKSGRDLLDKQFKNLELVIAAHLNFGAKHQLASDVAQLKVLLEAAKRGLDNEEDRRNSTYYSNQTQGACDRYFSQMPAAQPLTLARGLSQERASNQCSQERDASIKASCSESGVFRTQNSPSF